MEDFSVLCDRLRMTTGHKHRTKIISDFLHDSNEYGFGGDLDVLFRCLLPKESKLVYNIKDKQLVNLFSQVFERDKDEMLSDLEKAEDAATIIGDYFASTDCAICPAYKSTLTLQEVDTFLRKLSAASKEPDRLQLLTTVTRKCTVRDLVSLIRLICHDLRINAGCKQILDGLHPQAYAAFQASRDLQAVIRKVSDSESLVGSDVGHSSTRKPKFSRELNTGIRLMTPIKPMLAEACRSATHALSKVEPGGHLLAEIKYDGERVQIHKDGNKFAFFSRSLKAIPTNKVSHVEPYIPKAFILADQLIIDCELLLLDTKTGKPLPFGTLGVHKRTSFQDANVCVFVFDCIYLNGESLVEKPISHRRAVLEQYFTEVPYRVILSEKHIIENVASLNKLMARVFSENLEGLVLKSTHSRYEPGKRHWLKIKRDYLAEGSMADSVDLIVLGAYCGTGIKAGLMSVFLMGAYDPAKEQFVTVTKCGNGFTDEMLHNLQKTLNVKRITKSEVPTWLDVAKSLIPDFVVNDPKAAPVWEITGAEFSRASTHTANLSGDQTLGISIRFPRFTKARPDKNWKQATNVIELERLVQESGKRSDWLNLLNEASSSSPMKAMASKRMATSEFSDQRIKLTRTSVEIWSPALLSGHEALFRLMRFTGRCSKQSRHLSSLFSDMIVYVSEEAKFEKSDLEGTLRLLIAGGAELSGSVSAKFATFLNPKEATHVLVPAGYNKKSDQIAITPEMIHRSVASGKLISKTVR